MSDGTPRERKSHVWDRQSDNWYVEPTWVSRRLFEVEKFQGRTIDPCAGMGHVITGAFEAGVTVQGYDLRDRGYLNIIGGRDFFSKEWMPGIWPCENIVSNPPYGKRPDPLPGERGRLEEEFVRVALGRARSKVAVFLSSAWLNGAARGEWLESLPLYRVYFASPRASCPPGEVIQAGEKVGQGTQDYAWYVFLHGYDGPPAIKFLRRDGDA